MFGLFFSLFFLVNVIETEAERALFQGSAKFGRTAPEADHPSQRQQGKPIRNRPACTGIGDMMNSSGGMEV